MLENDIECDYSVKRGRCILKSKENDTAMFIITSQVDK